jgi:hypothetical protein
MFEITKAKKQIQAVLDIDGDGYTVLQGSTALVKGGKYHCYAKLRDDLIREGTLVSTADPRILMFTSDCEFSSISAAASVVLGRTASGNVEWKEVPPADPVVEKEEEPEPKAYVWLPFHCGTLLDPIVMLPLVIQ